jgi:hypothetical protein
VASTSNEYATTTADAEDGAEGAGNTRRTGRWVQDESAGTAASSSSSGTEWSERAKDEDDDEGAAEASHSRTADGPQASSNSRQDSGHPPPQRTRRLSAALSADAVTRRRAERRWGRGLGQGCGREIRKQGDDDDTATAARRSGGGMESSISDARGPSRAQSAEARVLFRLRKKR